MHASHPAHGMPKRRTPGGHDPVPLYKPQLARLVKKTPEGDAWLHELKYDGYRIGCRIVDGEVRLISRTGKDWTDAFPEIVEAARALAVRAALIDGAVAMLMPDGRTSFDALQDVFTGGSRARLVYLVFDLLHVAGETLVRRPLVERKAELLALVGSPQGRARIRYSEHVVGRGSDLFAEACRLGLDGIISKRVDAPYKVGRRDLWVKTQCVRAADVTGDRPTGVRAAPRARPRTRTAVEPRPLVAGIGISHPDRVLYPGTTLTKRRIAEYYERIGDWILPHVKGRPLTLVRCPDGIGGACFFMKHSKVWAPDALRRVEIQEKTKIGEYLIADTVKAVVSLVQMGVLEIHTWNTKYERVELPDRIVLDIDPGARVAWKQVIAAGRLVRRLLDRAGLPSFPKTTGGRGLHVVVPLRPKADWKACLEFSRRIASLLEEHDPDLYTTAFAKSGRERKILIDYLRNNRTNTSIAAYSTRAREGATISTPLRWDELKEKVEPSQWTVETIERRLATLKRDPWADYWKAAPVLPSGY